MSGTQGSPHGERDLRAMGQPDRRKMLRITTLALRTHPFVAEALTERVCGIASG